MEKIKLYNSNKRIGIHFENRDVEISMYNLFPEIITDWHNISHSIYLKLSNYDSDTAIKKKDGIFYINQKNKSCTVNFKAESKEEMRKLWIEILSVINPDITFYYNQYKALGKFLSDIENSTNV